MGALRVVVAEKLVANVATSKGDHIDATPTTSIERDHSATGSNARRNPERIACFGISANQKAQDTVEAIASLLSGIGADRAVTGGGGSDIDASVQAAHMPALSYDGTGSYFQIHHTHADTVDKIAPADVSRAAAAIAVMAYVIADLQARLGE